MTLSLSCERLQSGYRDTIILHDLRLAISSGQIYALMGKNGAGKTTFLKTVIGLVRVRSGSIELFGRDVTAWPTHRIIADGVSYAPQERAFFSELSVDENLRLGSLTLSERQYAERRDRVIAMFPFIGGRLRQRAGSLSGGEQSMVKVARALLPKPRLVLLDEVSEGLQPKAIDRVREVLAAEHQEYKSSMLLIEQNVDFVMGLASSFGLMSRGQIVGEGSFSDPDAARRIDQHLSI